MRRYWIVAASLLMLGNSGRPVLEKTLSFGKFGSVALYYPSAQPARVALFISGDGGWNLGVLDMARSLAGQDSLVVGIDITHYLRVLQSGEDQCLYPAADFEALSQFVQRELGYPSYITPVLVGYSSGATLAYATLVQAPSTTFRGAISLGFCPDLPLTKPMCRGSGLRWEPGPKGKGYNFLPAPQLEVPWVVLHGQVDQVCAPGATALFVEQTANGELISLPKVGHGFAVPKNWMPQFTNAFRRLADRQEAYLPPPRMDELKDLPLLEIPPSGAAADAFVVFITGDGGYGVTDRGLCTALAADGFPVAVLNSLRYFWNRRTPESAADDLQRILQHYLSVWKKERAILIGYSMGADVLPFMVNRLTAGIRPRVSQLVLLGPSPTVDFAFHLTNWLGVDTHKSDLPVRPELEKLRGTHILCLYGDQESDSICPGLDPALARVVLLKGGHRIGGNFSPVLEEIRKELSRKSP
jgi:type IV secretory pathway VirJ component